MTGVSRDQAVAMDAVDPIGSLRDDFVSTDPGLIYLDGNSLGRLPRRTIGRLQQVLEQEWGDGLIGSWQTWLDLPTRVGDLLAESVLGAGPGEVVVSDSTSVNLFKLASAAIGARPGRRLIITDDDNFPTDRYVLEGLAAAAGLELRIIHSDIDAGLDIATLAASLGPDTALVCLSQVAYRSGALLDMGAVTAAVQASGALMLWDLCHSAGAVPVDLAACGADLAVGCTYKYLNAGPGAPAYLFVRSDLQAELVNPIWGWFGQRDQFAMGPGYQPRPGIGRFLVGTTPVIGTYAVEEGVRSLAAAGVPALRAKGIALTDLLIQLADDWLEPWGFRVASPRDPMRRGSHVVLEHADAWRITQALLDRARVVPDYREPDRIRLGPAPAYTRFVDVWDGLDRLRQVVQERAFEAYDAAPGRVT